MVRPPLCRYVMYVLLLFVHAWMGEWLRPPCFVAFCEFRDGDTVRPALCCYVLLMQGWACCWTPLVLLCFVCAGMGEWFDLPLCCYVIYVLLRFVNAWMG
jgi:hypothetical protein